jgi:hypothetical protein
MSASSCIVRSMGAFDGRCGTVAHRPSLSRSRPFAHRLQLSSLEFRLQPVFVPSPLLKSRLQPGAIISHTHRLHHAL